MRKFNPFNLSFEVKLYIGLGLLLVGILPLSFFAISSFRTINKDRIELTERYARSLTVANRLRFEQSREESLVLRFVLTGDPTLYYQIIQARLSFVEKLEDLRNVDSDPNARKQISVLHKLKSDLVKVTAPALESRRNGASLEKTHRRMEAEGKPLSDALSKALHEMFQYDLKRFVETRRRVDGFASMMLRGLVLGAVITWLSLFAMVFLLVRLARRKHIHDVDRERLFEQSEKISLARKEVLEVVSHDLRNPLAAADLNLQLLKKEFHVTENSQSMSEKAISGALRATATMNDLVESLLDQARLEAGTLPLNLNEDCMDLLLEDLAKIFQPLAEAKQQRLSILMAGESIRFDFDRKRMSQALSNLIGNAIKFAPVGGHIEVKRSLTPSGLCISVSDDGPGIPASELPLIFDRFWQSSSARHKGAGLGLAIAKGVVEAHNGRIMVHSQMGRGSTFRVFFPTGKRAGAQASKNMTFDFSSPRRSEA